MSSVDEYRIYCYTESDWVHGYGVTAPTVCYNNTNHSVNENSVQLVNTISTIAETDSLNRLKINIMEESTLGDIKTTENSPIFQNYTLYGMINNQLYNIVTSSGGTITPNTNGAEVNINISETVNSSSMIQSTKVVKYRPGYSNLCRFNAVFDIGITNCVQYAGLGNLGSELYFGYNGPDFGIIHSTDGFPEVRKLTITTAETLTTTTTITLNGVEFVVPLITALGDTSFTAYQIAKYSFTGWDTENIGNVVIFTSKTIGNKSNTFSMVTTVGTSIGTMSTLKSGTEMTTTFIKQTDWNGNSNMINNLNPLMRNMYAIEYAWYGSGNIKYQIYNPNTGKYEVIHTLSFANLQTSPSITQPNLYLQIGIKSLGSTTSKTIKIAGSYATTDGVIKRDVPIYGISSSKSIAANTPTVIMAIKNRNSINGFLNQSEMMISRLTFSTDGNKSVKIKMIKNPTTLGNVLTTDYIKWNFINENNSIGLYDVTTKTFTGGEVIDTYQIPKSGSLYLDLKGREIYLFQKDIIILVAESTAISDVDIGMAIVDDL